jgi:hypothetical protein
MEKKRILIVGGGASGLTAGIMAAREGASVTILEQNDQIGKKICVTGNGKCNLTNLSMKEEDFRGEHPEFAQGILKQFPVEDTVRFFNELGIFTISRNGYLYPRSGQAKAIPDVLSMEARHLKIKIKTNEQVTAIQKEQGLWKVQTKTWTYEGDAVILANGSKASKVPGADGSGYAMAEVLGHRIIPPLPALTALKCSGNFLSAWAGVRVNGAVTLCVDGQPDRIQEGELQLTEYGISGIPVFQLSRYAIRALAEGKNVSLLVNFLPEVPGEQMEEFLRLRRKDCPYKSDKELLIGLFPEKLAKVLLSRDSLAEAVHAFPLKVREGLGFDQAQVCSGGVDTAEINPKTLESLLHKNLYFAGELLDIDGTCGGYNLQWAWSSGAVSGRHAAKENL